MDLVVMAAGMGSRFGGLKQVAPIDEDNNFILDYSIYDAVKAGFDRVIFIIKKENYEYFKQTIGERLKNVVKIEFVFQDINNIPKNVKIPANRVKPWGTAHAIYSCKDVVQDKFAVINADDFYGYESFKIVADFLKNSNKNEFVSAGYYAKNTLSDKGSVKRGVFSLDGDIAKSLQECEIELRNGELMATILDQDNWHKIDENTLVSMQMFGFNRKLIDEIIKEYIEKQENIKNVLKDIYNGKKDVYINEENLKGTLKEMAIYVNDISDGFSNAIEENLKSERLKTELITNVSHDIRTPLTSIINYVDLLKNENIQDEKVKEYIEILDKKSNRLKKLTEDLIEASKASSGNIKLNIEEIKIKELINQTIGEFKDKFEEKGLLIETKMPGRELKINADSRYIYRIIENLFSNITKYAQENTRVYIDITEENSMIRISIKNI